MECSRAALRIWNIRGTNEQNHDFLPMLQQSLDILVLERILFDKMLRIRCGISVCPFFLKEKDCSFLYIKNITKYTKKWYELFSLYVFFSLHVYTSLSLSLFVSGLSCAFLRQICVCPLGLALCNCHGCFVGAGARPPPQKLTSSLYFRAPPTDSNFTDQTDLTLWKTYMCIWSYISLHL